MMISFSIVADIDGAHALDDLADRLLFVVDRDDDRELHRYDAAPMMRCRARRACDSHAARLRGVRGQLALGLFFIFVWAPHPWGWDGFDHYHELALDARARAAVPDDGRAVGLRVFSRGVLPAVRRSSVDSAGRPGGAERRRAAAGLSRSRARGSIAARPSVAAVLTGMLFVQHGLRLDPVVRRRLHRACSWPRS